MKKYLLLAFAILLMPLLVEAQIWEDNFDDGDISDWTVNDVDGDGLNWELIGLGVGGSNCISSSSWTQAQGPVTPNNYITSPAIDLSMISGAVALDWSAYAQDQAWPREHYRVVVSAGSSLADIDGGEQIFEEILTAEGDQVWLERTVDLSAYAGETIYLTFIHDESTDWFRINVDDISVYQPAGADVGITGAVAPTNDGGCSFTDAENPTITLFNFGGSPISDFEVSYAVNGGALVTEMVTETIAPASSFDYVFNTSFDASALGTYTVDFSTSLEDDADVTNDILTQTFTHSDAVLTVHVQTDVSGGHAWQVVDNTTGEVVATRGAYSWDEEFFDDVCIYSDRCYSFEFVHNGGGMGPGTFLEILVDGQNVAGDTNGDGVPTRVFYPAIGGGCAAFDASVLNITTPTFHAIDGAAVISGVGGNFGASAINSIEMNYTVNGGDPVVEEFTGLDVASGTAFNYSFTTPVQIDNFDPKEVVVNVVSVNGEMDGNDGNNTATATLEAVSFIPRKKTVAEEGTGTWCPWCPRGETLLKFMGEEFGDDFIAIAVHNEDPMAFDAYDGPFGNLILGYPSIVLDRVNSDADPGGISDAQLDAMRADINERLNTVAPMTIDAEVSYTGDGTMTIDLSSEFVTNVDGAYRYNVVITEDNVTGTGGAWAQANNYAGGQVGPMDGYENLPNPVPADQMVYNHVARALLGGFNGTISSIPASNQRGDVISYQYTYDIDDVSNIDNYHVVAMIIDQTTGAIINATSVNAFTTDTDDIAVLENDVKVFPNPSNGQSFVEVSLSETQAVKMSVFNTTGQLVAQRNYGELSGKMVLPINAEGFETGMYYINLQIGTEMVSKKLVVSK